jgi:hypothetical protein
MPARIGIQSSELSINGWENPPSLPDTEGLECFCSRTKRLVPSHVPHTMVVGGEDTAQPDPNKIKKQITKNI